MRDFGRRTSIALVVALVVASCGSASGTSAESTTTTEATTSTTVGTTTSSSQAADATTTTAREETTTTTSVAGDEHADTDRTVDIVLTDFAFEPEQLEVSGGETIKFVVVNEGAVDHEFRLSNAHRIEEHLASGHEDHGDEGGHHSEGGDVYVVVEPGQVGELVVTFPEDTTVYTATACLLPGHYEAGMVGTIVYSDS